MAEIGAVDLTEPALPRLSAEVLEDDLNEAPKVNVCLDMRAVH